MSTPRTQALEGSVSLMDLFKQNGGNAITHEGRELHWTYAIPVADGDQLIVRFLRWSDRPIQGIGLEGRNCRLRAADTMAKKMALWVDTAPREVHLSIDKAKGGAELRVFNQWRDEKYGTTLYRLNNAAMEVQLQPDGALLFRCSDGWEGPDFNDLVFQVSR